MSKYVQEYTESHRLKKISPKVIFISPPTALPEKMTLKTDFEMPALERRTCAQRGANLRYMMVERVGSNLEDLWDKAFKLSVDIRIGFEILKKILENLKILHEMNVIHGDIHSGNIARGLQGPDRNEIFLIDYGLARFHTPLSDTPVRRVAMVSTQLSPWELQGYEKSFRDDIFRTFIIFGTLIGGRERWELLHRWDTDNSRESLQNYLDLYSKTDIISTPGLPSPWESLGGQSRTIRGLWLEIVDHVRGLGINDKPQYRPILYRLDKILSLIPIHNSPSLVDD
jgi:serine/threonine protein kinase